MFVISGVMSLFNLPKDLLVRWYYLIIQHMFTSTYILLVFILIGRNTAVKKTGIVCALLDIVLIGERENMQISNIISDAMCNKY